MLFQGLRRLLAYFRRKRSFTEVGISSLKLSRASAPLRLCVSFLFASKPTDTSQAIHNTVNAVAHHGLAEVDH
jgi:hypothetical protein